jgi:alpha-tubulin suppressor-like RCC1 family protein
MKKLLLTLTVILTISLSPQIYASYIVSWGGQSILPLDSDFIFLAEGDSHNLALRADGTAVGWGFYHCGQADPPPDNDFVMLAAGGGRCGHSLGLKSDGSIMGWGSTIFDQSVPPEGNDFVMISTGAYHSLALKSDASIVGWGHDNYGQATPPEGNDFVSVSGGAEHSLALKNDGSIIGWGNNIWGQSNTPLGNDFVMISAGPSHSLALKSDGSISAWGSNYHGQADIPSGNDFVMISAGGGYNLALKSDGSIIGWGRNNLGQATPPEGKFISISAGTYAGFALKSATKPTLEVPVKFTPHVLNTASNGQWVKFHCTLPAEYSPNDVDINTPAICSLSGLEILSDYIYPDINDSNLTEIEIAFPRSAFHSVPAFGPVTITITGKLTNGYFYTGQETIRLINKTYELIQAVTNNWLFDNCTAPDFCQGGDINKDGYVDLLDLSLLTSNP